VTKLFINCASFKCLFISIIIVIIITVQSSYASEVLGFIILSVCQSVRLSVRPHPSHACCDETREHTAEIFRLHERV